MKASTGRSRSRSSPTAAAASPAPPAPTPAQRPPSPDELAFAQLAQTILAQRAQAIAVIEQCDAALMVVHALQERERQRIASLQPIEPMPGSSPPRTFGMSVTNGDIP
jgi:hypothetical protein